MCIFKEINRSGCAGKTGGRNWCDTCIRSKYDEAAVDDLTKKILEKLPDLTTTLPLSLIFGATGEEYNNIAVSIAGGNDVKEQLKALQEYAANAVE